LDKLKDTLQAIYHPNHSISSIALNLNKQAPSACHDHKYTTSTILEVTLETAEYQTHTR